MGEWQPGRGTWNRTARIRRVESLGRGYCRWILAEVTRVGAPASFQQEDSQRWVRASAWGIPSPPIPILSYEFTWLASVLS